MRLATWGFYHVRGGMRSNFRGSCARQGGAEPGIELVAEDCRVRKASEKAWIAAAVDARARGFVWGRADALP